MPQPKRSYLSYSEAIEYVRKRNIRSREHYWKWWDSHTPHPPVPKMPHRVYAEWESWNHFLGTTNSFEGNLAKKKREKKVYRTFWEAVRYAQQKAKEYNITSQGDWEQWHDSGMCASDVPKRPHHVYEEFVGVGWNVWLGKNVKAKVDTAKQGVAVMAICRTIGQPPNVVTLMVEGGGLSAMRDKWDDSVMGKPYRVYKWEREMAKHVEQILLHYAHKRDERVWLVPNMNALLFELDSLLEYAIEPRQLS